MRRHLALALALAVTPVAVSATEIAARNPGPPQIQQPAMHPALPHTERITIPDRVEEARRAEEAAAVRQPDRVGWWWLLAAIVIGGIIVVAVT